MTTRSSSPSRAQLLSRTQQLMRVLGQLVEAQVAGLIEFKLYLTGVINAQRVEIT